MGKLVLTRLQGALNVGSVLGYNGDRARVLLQGEESERKIRREALIWTGAECPANETELHGWLEEQLQGMFDRSKGVSIETLWEKAWELNQGKPIGLPGLLELLSEDLDEGALVVALELARSHFKRQDGGYGPFSPEQKEEREARRKAPWSSQWRDARLVLFRGYLLDESVPESSIAWEDVIEILVRLGIATEQRGYPGRERRFVEEALGRPLLRPSDEARAFLEKMGIWATDEPVEALREGIPLTHTRQTESDAQLLKENSHHERGVEQGRSQWPHADWVAVDESSTMDVDDALYAERVEGADEIRVHVAIADPSEWITPDSNLWREAQLRGSSMYLPRGVYGMLPETISDQFSSLIPGEERLALCFSWTVNEKGHVRDFEVQESLINVDCRATYEQMDEAIALGDRPMWEVLRDAAARMRQRRGNGGGLLVRQVEWKCSLSGESGPKVKKLDPFSPARETVSELMIATGILSGEYCEAKGIPGVFRTQPPPDEIPDYSVEGVTDASELYELFRTMKRAELSTRPGHHYMLGARAYTQVSSPLRRFCDLVMHRQLKSYLRTGEVAWSEREIRNEIQGVETSVRTRLKVERERHRLRVLELLENEREKAVRGQVVRRLGKRFLVALLDLGIREACNLQGGVEVGDFVTLHVGSVSPRLHQLELVHR